METFTRQDQWLAMLGIATMVWCVCLTLYAVISDSKQKTSSLHTVTDSFAALLIALGERLRNGTSAR
jgi:hypothetical protein